MIMRWMKEKNNPFVYYVEAYFGVLCIKSIVIILVLRLLFKANLAWLGVFVFLPFSVKATAGELEKVHIKILIWSNAMVLEYYWPTS